MPFVEMMLAIAESGIQEGRIKCLGDQVDRPAECIVAKSSG